MILRFYTVLLQLIPNTSLSWNKVMVWFCPPWREGHGCTIKKFVIKFWLVWLKVRFMFFSSCFLSKLINLVRHSLKLILYNLFHVVQMNSIRIIFHGFNFIICVCNAWVVKENYVQIADDWRQNDGFTEKEQFHYQYC